MQASLEAGRLVRGCPGAIERPSHGATANGGYKGCRLQVNNSYSQLHHKMPAWVAKTLDYSDWRATE